MSEFDDHPDYYRGLGHRLRVTRIALGISEAEAAAAAKRSVRTWRKYEETGRLRGSSTYNLLCFADKYDVSLDWLVAGDGTMFRSNFRKATKITVLPQRCQS